MPFLLVSERADKNIIGRYEPNRIQIKARIRSLSPGIYLPPSVNTGRLCTTRQHPVKLLYISLNDFTHLEYHAHFETGTVEKNVIDFGNIGILVMQPDSP